MDDARRNLGQRIVEAAKLAVWLHLELETLRSTSDEMDSENGPEDRRERGPG